MEKSEGIHFYVNVENFNDVVLNEEQHTGKVNHSIHALDTFFTSIEYYGKTNFPKSFVVEKITGSRLHMYVVEDIAKAYSIVQEVVKYAGQLARYLNVEISKYKTLMNFRIQTGACFGQFYNFVFKRENADEETTIGYAANYAAKLQGLSKKGSLAISSKLYDALDKETKKLYTKIVSSKIKKYGEDCYYETRIGKLQSNLDNENYLKASQDYANKVNLTNMEFRQATKPVSFDKLSKTECKELQGIPLFADVRGFTSKFDSDDANLDEMAIATQNILTTMYNKVEQNHGIHVQFQGDREVALFHNYPGHECYFDAVKAGLQLIDAVKPYGVSIGVGQSFGKMFATRIGARNEKDYLLIGTVVVEADRNEDENAKPNQLVISREIYEYLKNHGASWAEIFKKQDDYYYTTVGYNFMKNKITQKDLETSTKRQNYNGAWMK